MDYVLKPQYFVVAMVNVTRILLHIIEYEVHRASFVLMGHLLYLVHKFSFQGVYEYDIQISEPSSHGKVSALSQEMQGEKFCILLFCCYGEQKY